MAEKYLCMKDRCNFMTDDEPEAIEHFEMEHGHDVVGVIWDDGRAICHPLGVRTESFDEYGEEYEIF